MKIIHVRLFCLLMCLAQVSARPAATDPMVAFLQEYLQIKYPLHHFDQFIYIAAKKQKLYFVSSGEIEASYTISVAKNGIGNQIGSFQTPDGLHTVAEKVGDGLPIHAVIRHKIPTGESWEPIQEAMATNQDVITTRILHLRGMERDKNSGPGIDSYARGIFIHGTHEEGLLGTAASKGCIRMGNKDVIDLFERAEVGTFVVILNN